jgi:hypothetical protein
MDIANIRAEYDRFERREAMTPGMEREAFANRVRLVDSRSCEGFIAWSALSEHDALQAIDEEISFFTEAGKPFEWKLYSHDTPANLKALLTDRGFAIGDDEAVMALDMEERPVTVSANPAVRIRRITDPGDLGDLSSIRESVWPGDTSSIIDSIASELASDPDFVSVYVASVDGKPACSARINFPANSPFASLWGGSTIAEYRNRGIYSALLAIRAREAVGRGYRYLTIDASPMSRPIAAKHGFQLIATSNECVYTP